MKWPFRLILRRVLELCLAALLGAAVWSLAVLAMAEYSTPVAGPGKMIRDFAVPVSAMVAAMAFLFNRAHQQRILRRDRERLMVDAAVGWLGKALDLADVVLDREYDEPLYHAAPSFQLDTIALLLSEAQSQRPEVCELDLQRRLKVEMSYAGAKLLALLRFRETAEFFDFGYYSAAHEAAGRSINIRGAVSIAVYHNSTLDLMNELEERVDDLELGEVGERSIGHLQHFIRRVRNGGGKPFPHPFFGSGVPLDSMETVLRFALGKPEPECELADLLEDEEAAEHWSLSGLYILLYQAAHFRPRPDGKVFNVLKESQVAEAIAAGAPNPSLQRAR